MTIHHEPMPDRIPTSPLPAARPGGGPAGEQRAAPARSSEHIDHAPTAPLPSLSNRTAPPSRQFQTAVAAPTRPNPLTPAPALPPLPPTPVPPAATPTRRARRKRRLALPIAAALVLLAALIVVGAIIGSSSPNQPGNNDAALLSQSLNAGPFVSPSLNAQQRNSLSHLTSYMKYKQLAAMYVARMSLDVEIGQVIMVEYGDTYYSSDLNYMITQLHAGGVIMYQFQMPTFNATKQEISQMQAHSSIPLLISTDEEGGPYVDRLTQIYGPRMSPTQMEETGDPNVAAQQGHKTAHDLMALGINNDLAPDVDVNLVNGYDMVTRTFGNTPQQVITYAGAFLRALQAYGVVGCIKHYPGLGDATPDAHKTLPVVNQTRSEIYNIDLAPFKAFIQSRNVLDNPGMIMPTDVLMPAIDPTYPAELSHIFMTDILRKQFGYDGVSLTDALYMQGIAKQWSLGQASVMALNAGNDMILGPTGSAQTLEVIDAIKAALQNGTLSKTRLDEAATRIIALKMEYHLMPAVPPQG